MFSPRAFVRGNLARAKFAAENNPPNDSVLLEIFS